MPTNAVPYDDPEYQEWLRTYDVSKYMEDRLSVAVDVVVLSANDEGALQTFLIRRTQFPERNRWVLPGGFVRKGELLSETVNKVLTNKIGLGPGPITEPFRFFDNPDRDYRTRVLSMTYITRCARELLPVVDDDRTRIAPIVGSGVRIADTDPQLGFDHDEILSAAVDFARKATQENLLWPVPLLSGKGTFTVAELERVRAGLGAPMSRDALRRKLVEAKLERHGWVEADKGKPVQVYRHLPSEI